VQREGHGGLWKGVTSTMFRAFYANAIGFYTYEFSKSFILNKYMINE
jgi:hypothetical protein